MTDKFEEKLNEIDDDELGKDEDAVREEDTEVYVFQDSNGKKYVFEMEEPDFYKDLRVEQKLEDKDRYEDYTEEDALVEFLDNYLVESSLENPKTVVKNADWELARKMYYEIVMDIPIEELEEKLDEGMSEEEIIEELKSDDEERENQKKE